jgi:ribosomal protein S18 acetylase RimI-like enzyme
LKHLITKEVRMINVRRGTTDDYQNVLQLLSQVWEDDYVEHLWLQWAQEAEKGIVLVAEYENELVGTSYVNFMPHNACWFQALRVHPEHRRLGIGRALTSVSLELSRANGREYAYLGIDADNTASLTLTARAGFRRVSEYTRLITKLPARKGRKEEHPSYWKRAVSDDTAAMLDLAHSLGRTELIAGWQWQLLSRETIAENVSGNNLWVWKDESLCLFAGFEDIEHPHLFDPCGEQARVERLIIDLTKHLTREHETTFEVWLHHENPLTGRLIEEMAFVPEVGYTIWEYNLASKD